MQIRKTGKRYQLLRTVYDPSRKRGRTQSLGSIPLDATRIDAVSTNVLEGLTIAEREELEQHLYRRKTELEQEAQLQAVHGFEGQAKLIADLLSEHKIDQEKAGSLFRGIDTVQQALKKAGWTKKGALGQPNEEKQQAAHSGSQGSEEAMAQARARVGEIQAEQPGISLSEIARRLNSEGFATVTGRGSWGHKTVKKYLT